MQSKFSQQKIMSCIDDVNRNPEPIVEYLSRSSNLTNYTVVIYHYLKFLCYKIKGSQEVDHVVQGNIVLEMLKNRTIIENLYITYLNTARIIANRGRDIALQPVDVFIEIAKEIVEDEWS